MKREILTYIIQRNIPGRGIFSAQILSYGPYIRSLRVPMRPGEMREVVLGLQKMSRYPRRLPGEHYRCVDRTADSIRFEGDGGDIVSYALPESDLPTLLVQGAFIPDLYVNLMGHGVLNILDHRLTIRAHRFLRGDGEAAASPGAQTTRHRSAGPRTEDTPEEGVRIGGVLSGDGEPVSFLEDPGPRDRYGVNPLDFTDSTIIGERIRVGHPELTRTHGYDTVYQTDVEEQGFLNDIESCLKKTPQASLTDFYYGLTMEVRSDSDLLHFETGNRMSGRELGRGGCIYSVHGGLKLTPIPRPGRSVLALYRFVPEEPSML